MTQRLEYCRAVRLGLFALTMSACGGDEDPPPVGVHVNRQTLEVVVENRTGSTLEMEVSAGVTCAQVGRNDIVQLGAFTLAAGEAHAMPLTPDNLELTRLGNKGPCLVRPNALGNTGVENFAIAGGSIMLDSSGRLVVVDDGAFFKRRCFEPNLCTHRE